MTTARTSPRLELGLAFMAACTAAVFLYGGLRLVQFRLFPEPNPANVIWSAHAGYFWRCWIVSYAGVLVGFAAYAGAKVDPARVAEVLVKALWAAAAMITLQGLLVP